MYIYIYISSILIYIHTFTSYKSILHPLPPLPHHQGVQYIYIVVIPIPYEPLAVNNEAGKLSLGGKYPKTLENFSVQSLKLSTKASQLLLSLCTSSVLPFFTLP